MAFSLVYLGLCRVLGLVVSSRRGEADKDVDETTGAQKRQATGEDEVHGGEQARETDMGRLAGSVE